MIVQALDWRFIFILVLPIRALALGLGIMRVQNVTEPRAIPFDVLSVILSAFAFGGLISGSPASARQCPATPSSPPGSPLTVGGIALVTVHPASAHASAARAGVPRPAHLQVARIHRRRSSSWSIMMGALFGTIILLPIYTQDVLGSAPAASGLLLVPGSLLMGIAGPFIGRLYDRWARAPLILPGRSSSAVYWGSSRCSRRRPHGGSCSMRTSC